MIPSTSVESRPASNLTALQMEIVPEDVRPFILDFFRDQIKSMDYRAFTGILGTSAYIDVLRREDRKLLYKIVLKNKLRPPTPTTTACSTFWNSCFLPIPRHPAGIRSRSKAPTRVRSPSYFRGTGAPKACLAASQRQGPRKRRRLAGRRSRNDFHGARRRYRPANDALLNCGFVLRDAGIMALGCDPGAYFRDLCESSATFIIMDDFHCA